MKNRIVCIFFLFIIASTLQAQTAVRAIDDIKQEYQEFHYKKVIEKGLFYLGEPYLEKNDSLVIFTYLLNASFNLDRISESRQYVSQILKVAKNFQLDPKINSPKVIGFFNTQKKQILTQQDRGKPVPQKQDIRKSKRKDGPAYLAGALTLVFPGGGHIMERINDKSYYRSLVSAFILTGVVYQTVRTNELEKKYLSAGHNANFDNLFNNYNSSYKTRNGLYVLYSVWALYCLYDLHRYNRYQLSIVPIQGAPRLSLDISF